jgi:hypothetical protein
LQHSFFSDIYYIFWSLCLFGFLSFKLLYVIMTIIIIQYTKSAAWRFSKKKRVPLERRKDSVGSVSGYPPMFSCFFISNEITIECGYISHVYWVYLIILINLTHRYDWMWSNVNQSAFRYESVLEYDFLLLPFLFGFFSHFCPSNFIVKFVKRRSRCSC